MRKTCLKILLACGLALALVGCAANQQTLPFDQAQRADEIGPQTGDLTINFIYQPLGVPAGGTELPGMLFPVAEGQTEVGVSADGKASGVFSVGAINVTFSQSQQGSTEQEQAGTGGGAGPVDQRPEGTFEVQGIPEIAP